jgi:hypothetical protein
VYHWVIYFDVRIFVGKKFRNWANSESISDKALCDAAKEAFGGHIDGDLGGFLFKKRVARKGQGKSSGFRTILGFRKNNSDRIFFLYGFAKKTRSNITSREKYALSIAAKSFILANDQQLDDLKNKGSIVELECE